MADAQQVLARLRVQIVAAHNLIGRDRHGKTSDPYVVLSIPGVNLTPSASGSSKPSSSNSSSSSKRQTPAISKTVNPVWKPEEATFDLDVTPVWLGTNEEGVLPGGGRSLYKRSLSGAASKYLLQPARKIPKGAAAGARVIGRKAPKPMRMKRNNNNNNNNPSEANVAPASATTSAQASISASPSPTDAASRQEQQRAKPDLHRLATNVNTANLEPPPGSAVLNPSGASHAVVRALEFVLWDKDRFSADDYLGECSLPVKSWATASPGEDGSEATTEVGSVAWEHAKPITIPVVSHRRRREVSGELIVKVGLLPPSAPPASHANVDDVYHQLLLANTSDAALGVRGVPADQSLGTASAAEAFIDDGLSSGSEEDEEILLTDDEEDGGDGGSRPLRDDAGSETDTGTESEDIYRAHYQSIAGVPSLTRMDSDQIWPLATPQEPVVLSTPPIDSVPAPTKRRLFGKMGRSSSSTSLQSARSQDAAGTEGSGSGDGVTKGRLQKVRKPKKPRRKMTAGRRAAEEFAFKAEMGMDIIGIVMMEVQGAHNLPLWKNVTKISFDMDPFAIVSFGQKIFRTRVVRHSLNPVWDEKLLFHVRRHESGFMAKFAIYDWDRMSSHDFVGGTELQISELVELAPKPDPATGLYAADLDWTTAEQGMQSFTLSLHRTEHDEDVKFGRKQAPKISVKAKFTPYDLLRQSFWRHLLLQYDTNDSKSLSELELTTMLDSLGSTLSSMTIRSWFQRYGKSAEDGDELSFEEAILVLEEEIKKPWSQKRRVRSSETESGASTPALEIDRQLRAMGFSGSDAPTLSETCLAHEPVPVPSTVLECSETKTTNAPMLKPLLEKDISSTALSVVSMTTTMTSGSSASGTHATPVRTVSSASDVASESVESGQVEQVIKLKSCPLCHMGRLNRKGEMDIVTHLAVCASQDWRRVDSMLVRNFVTANQAHRKWYTKVLTKISQGSYALGANSANIIVQDRQSGELLEEKMQVYVRLGIRLLYQGAKSRMESARVKKMLKNMSIKQGVKFDDPASVREIAPFIAFHNLNIEEIFDPLDSFKTFNEFFYRKLKPDARPIAEPAHATRLVSGADCRMMAFESVNEATRIWIKGRGFSVEALLGDKYKGKVNALKDGALCIFRLAPQDYHRFHCPADAVVHQITPIEGQYYTVNPMAIRSAIDVYGENIRVVVEFHSPQFGRFFAVCVGAMMVGSTVLTKAVGDSVARGDELGYFKFGGSTIVLIFEKGRCVLDEDLLDNSNAAIETLVRVGMGIGRATLPR
ncbi:hypothetical protein K437DRAFT_258852 [Tilletiaria anomala UBC 951]|uniref:Phosphatidylserine decarboxylase proenzyme 2 n=1 Tax=Tilletiaria anomala (strain ATCC 24038 / CBS 436.72 / UBC 951) TaxID=1037660 RepID=A0A066VEQ4_TILAU|nr:uncharacterized protein K437DRAFT_258852 [Tilletiaria anomala UBC 951]KDN39916.1 hypothetical protein K437DRAFT_258852 [Tilletiaria anomala UBC 951]